jgi:hypothetical protein
MIGDKPDIPWSDGWDVLIPWEVDLAMRQRERDELLRVLQGQAGMASYPGGVQGIPGGIGGVSGTTAPGTTTASATGGA